jgi:hypothetical protein
MAGKANGISRAEAERSYPRALQALRAVPKQSEQGGFGFPHLPFRTQVVKSVVQCAGEMRGSYDTVCVFSIGGSA